MGLVADFLKVIAQVTGCSDLYERVLSRSPKHPAGFHPQPVENIIEDMMLFLRKRETAWAGVSWSHVYQSVHTHISELLSRASDNVVIGFDEDNSVTLAKAVTQVMRGKLADESNKRNGYEILPYPDQSTVQAEQEYAKTVFTPSRTSDIARVFKTRWIRKYFYMWLARMLVANITLQPNQKLYVSGIGKMPVCLSYSPQVGRVVINNLPEYEHCVGEFDIAIPMWLRIFHAEAPQSRTAVISKDGDMLPILLYYEQQRHAWNPDVHHGAVYLERDGIVPAYAYVRNEDALHMKEHNGYIYQYPEFDCRSANDNVALQKIKTYMHKETVHVSEYYRVAMAYMKTTFPDMKHHMDHFALLLSIGGTDFFDKLPKLGARVLFSAVLKFFKTWNYKRGALLSAVDPQENLDQTYQSEQNPIDRVEMLPLYLRSESARKLIRFLFTYKCDDTRHASDIMTDDQLRKKFATFAKDPEDQTLADMFFNENKVEADRAIDAYTRRITFTLMYWKMGWFHRGGVTRNHLAALQHMFDDTGNGEMTSVYGYTHKNVRESKMYHTPEEHVKPKKTDIKKAHRVVNDVTLYSFLQKDYSCCK